VKRRRLTGEIRFRISKEDLARLQWLLENAPIAHPSPNVSAVLRTLILREYERLQPKTAH
jgi:hypothetical protein